MVQFLQKTMKTLLLNEHHQNQCTGNNSHKQKCFVYLLIEPVPLYNGSAGIPPNRIWSLSKIMKFFRQSWCLQMQCICQLLFSKKTVLKDIKISPRYIFWSELPHHVFYSPMLPRRIGLRHSPSRPCCLRPRSWCFLAVPSFHSLALCRQI